VRKTFVAITEFLGETTFEYSKSFELFGITFAIHHPHSIPSWYVVSEVTTGLRACPTLFRTMVQARKEGQKFLEEKGEAAIKKAITKGRRKNTITLKKLKREQAPNA
jgi:hypothetical protein